MLRERARGGDVDSDLNFAVMAAAAAATTTAISDAAEVDAELERLWSLVDQDGSGSMDLDELRTLCLRIAKDPNLAGQVRKHSHDIHQ